MNPQTEYEIENALGREDEGAVEVIEEEEAQGIVADAEAMSTALATALPSIDAGTYALASLSEEDFDRRLAMLRAGRVRIAKIQAELLRPGVDFGLIPGTEKPTLLKPGAEKLCDFYRFAADFLPEIVTGDDEHTPAVSVLVRCSLHLGSTDGPVVAVGYGQANSWEKRYRYRKGGKPCPECGAVGTLTAKPTGQGSHWCIPDRGGCNANVSVERYEKIEAQAQVQNPDPHDLANTLLKIGEKRSHIDATLRATATSGLFTQDVEDQPPQRQSPRGTPETASRPSGERASEGMDQEDGLPDIRDGESAAAAEGICPVHSKPFRIRKAGTGTFWSCGTKGDDGKWCPERPSAAWAAAQEVTA